MLATSPPPVDTTKPTASFTAPQNNQVLPVGPIVISGNANDDLSGVAATQIAIRNRDTMLYWNPSTNTWGSALKWIPTALASPGTLSTTWTYTWSGASHGGRYRVTVRAIDNATNTGVNPYPATQFSTP